MMNASTLLNLSQEEGTSRSFQAEPGYRTAGIAYILAGICVFLVTANALLLYCIQTNKNKSWAKNTRQTFHLIVSDLVLGLLLIPLIANFALNIQTKTYIYCAFINFTSILPSGVSLYHMLSVCTHRYRMVKKVHLPSSNDAYRYDIESGVIWVLATLAFVPPYIVWARNDAPMVICVPTELFGPANRQATIYIMTLYLLPAALTNAIYVTALCHLRMRLNAVQSVPHLVRYTNNPGPSRLPHETQGETDRRAVTMVIQQSISTSLSTQTRSKMSKIMKLVGLLLVALNISVLSPVIALSMVTPETSNTLIGPLVFLSYFNNISNPFIHSLSIAPLREELITVLRRMLSHVLAVPMRIITRMLPQ